MKNLIRGLSAGILCLAPVLAQTITTDKPVYEPTDTVTVSWTGGPGNATDWVGVYKPADTPGPVAATKWTYINGAADGSATFTGLAVGGWKVYLFSNDGYDIVAGPAEFSVGNVNPTIDSFVTDHNFIDDGVPVTLSWSISSNGQTVDSVTLSDGVNPAVDVTGLTSYDVSPTATTTYTLNVNTGLALKNVLVLKNSANTASFSLNSTALTTDQTLKVTWDAVIANPDAWVGIYAKNANVGTTHAVNWNYLNGTHAAGGSVPAGEMSFTLPAGEYFACMFLDENYTLQQGPILFTVSVPALPFAITKVELFNNGLEVDVIWNSVPDATYNVYGSDDMQGNPQTDWDVVGTDIPSGGSNSIITDYLSAPAPRRFYMVFRNP